MAKAAADFDKRIREIIRERQIEDAKAVCSTPQGRRFVRSIIKFCGVYTSNVGVNNDVTNVGEGRRQVGLFMLHLLQRADPYLHLKLEQEYISEQLSNEVKRAKAKEGATE